MDLKKWNWHTVNVSSPTVTETSLSAVWKATEQLQKQRCDITARLIKEAGLAENSQEDHLSVDYNRHEVASKNRGTTGPMTHLGDSGRKSLAQAESPAWRCGT